MRPFPLIAILLCLLAPATRGQTIHVPADHATIQAAINAAPNGATIVVAPGTYTENLTVASQVLTIRSSGGPGATTLRGNAARALTMVSGANIRLEGFSIIPATPGTLSGILSSGSTLAVRDCTFQGCTTTFGGAARIEGGSASFADCRFVGNTANSFGGAISVIGSGNIAVHSCLFQQNSSGTAGGAIDLQPGTATVANTRFVQNSSANGGGFATITPGSQVTNCTFANNTITTGVGQAVAFGGIGTQVVTIANSIFWGNTGGNGGPIASTGGPSTTFAVTYSNVQGGYAGTGNINADPMFVAVGIPGDYRLQPASPCIDAGSNTALPLDVLDVDGDGNVSEPLPLDLAGAARRSDDPATPDTGEGAAPIVDIGAYEFAATPPCRADFDEDGVVNSNDISAFLTEWLQAVTGGCP